MSGGGPPEVPGGRSEEERERARAERAARRGDGSTAGRQPRSEPLTEPHPLPGGLGSQSDAPASPRQLTIGIAGGIALAVAVVAISWAAISYFQPFTGPGGEPVRVVVPEGAGLAQIASMLDEQGVISSPLFFRARARIKGLTTDLKPGSYKLPTGASNAAVLTALAAGPPRDVVQVTVPEGGSREEISRAVKNAGLGGSYLRATKRSDALDPSRYGAEDADDLEGFLFPSTYELDRGSSAQALVRKQLEAFKREVAKVDMSEAERRNLTVYDVLIVASMVEREAQIPNERPVIASVIYNRLRADQPLGIDATIRYATGNWTRPIRESQLKIGSPYNTYINQGLPPGPIGSPGRASIEAAAKPADTDFRFYVVKPNTCGEHSFSETDTEFVRDQARYEAERQRRGGQSPTDCPPTG